MFVTVTNNDRTLRSFACISFCDTNESNKCEESAKVKVSSVNEPKVSKDQSDLSDKDVFQMDYIIRLKLMQQHISRSVQILKFNLRAEDLWSKKSWESGLLLHPCLSCKERKEFLFFFPSQMKWMNHSALAARLKAAWMSAKRRRLSPSRVNPCLLRSRSPVEVHGGDGGDFLHASHC